jgi:cytochrome c-type biogenesis protein CcmH/NrfG
LILFVAIPALFVGGLLLIPRGARLDARRRRLHPGAPPADWPVIDLRIPHHRRIFLAVLMLTAVNLVLVSMASYGAVHYMERTEFCGLVCHTTMDPQFTAQAEYPDRNAALQAIATRLREHYRANPSADGGKSSAPLPARRTSGRITCSPP